MQALLLDGSRPQDNLDAVRDALVAEMQAKGWEVEVLPLAEMDLGPCLGCFGCWIKTPGRCCQEDDEERVLRAQLRSQVIVNFTPVLFGGFSEPLKAAVDRSVPLAVPFFERRHGEVHHPSRYPNRYAWIAVGALPGPGRESEAIFRRLAERNVRNMEPLAAATAVVYTGDPPEATREKLRAALAQVEVAA